MRVAKKYCFTLFFLLPLISYSQGTQTEFGQNRVQYKDFIWSYYETEKFVTYFYLGGQDIGKYVIQFAEKEVNDIEDKLEYKLTKRIHIMVYNDLSDLNQTNIGSTLELFNTGGVTKVIENKIFVYFNGDHKNLEMQVKQGIAQVMLSHMMFGGNLQEILQNAVLLNLPEWYTSGLASYMGEEWSVEMDNNLREGILSGRYKKFNRLKGEDLKFAGHAVWHYVEEKYGKSAVPNLLYLTRINRSMESGFLFVLGGNVKSILADWYDYYYEHYSKELETSDSLLESSKVIKKAKKKKHQYQVKISADRKHLAYVSNELGAYKVHVLNTENHKSRRVKRGGLKTITLVTDYSYPLLSWSPDGKMLAIIYEKRDKLYLLLYDNVKHKKVQQPLTKFQQINDFAFTDDPRLLVMSAVNRGQSDIYTYYIPSNLLEPITDDYYDDLDAGYYNADGKRGILFVSNRKSEILKEERLDTTLLSKNFDVFFYDLDKRQSKLLRVSSSEHFREKMPVQYNDRYFSFLGDNNGIQNRYVGYFQPTFDRYDTTVYFPDSVVVNPVWEMDSVNLSKTDSIRFIEVFKDTAIFYPVTNYGSNIIEHDISAAAGKSIDLLRVNSKFEFYINDLVDTVQQNSKTLDNTNYRKYLMSEIEKQKQLEMDISKVKLNLEDEEETEDSIKPEDYFFQSDFNTSPEIDVSEDIEDGSDERDQPIFRFSRVAPYKVKFSTDFVTAQLDNSIIMNRYQKYAPGSPIFDNPVLGALINVGIGDLFEDYKITGGFRFPFDFKGSEYFIAYENLRKRLDKKIMYYRKVDKQEYPPGSPVPFSDLVVPDQPGLPLETKIKTNYAELRLNFPFDVIKSLRWYLAYRHDNFVFQSTSDFSLNLPNHKENWLYAKMEYVHDNTIKVATNILHGMRFKIYGEFHKEFTIEQVKDLKLKLPDFNDAYLGVVGADFRYYQKIWKQIIWANRIAWASSFGTRKLIYYLGGVDGWVTPRFDNQNQPDESENYAFQTIATNMRGFQQNVRNGANYIILNSELRIPVFTSLFNSTIKSQFIRNFQIVGFTDIGTAWKDNSDEIYLPANPNLENITAPVIVRVEYFKNRIITGYGFGLRTTLLGYFIRLDFAWGNDSGVQSNKPVFYLSFSLDF